TQRRRLRHRRHHPRPRRHLRRHPDRAALALCGDRGRAAARAAGGARPAAGRARLRPAQRSRRRRRWFATPPQRAIGKANLTDGALMASDRLFSLFLRRGKTRANDLGRMTLGELAVAYATYPSVIFYAVLMVVFAAGSIRLGALHTPWRTLA